MAVRTEILYMTLLSKILHRSFLLNIDILSAFTIQFAAKPIMVLLPFAYVLLWFVSHVLSYVKSACCFSCNFVFLLYEVDVIDDHVDSGQIPLQPFCQNLIYIILEGGFSLSTSTFCSPIVFQLNSTAAIFFHSCFGTVTVLKECIIF